MGMGRAAMQQQMPSTGLQPIGTNQAIPMRQPMGGDALSRILGGMLARQPFGLSPYMGYGMLSPQFAMPQQFRPTQLNPINPMMRPNVSAPLIAAPSQPQTGAQTLSYNQFGAPVFPPINLIQPSVQQPIISSYSDNGTGFSSPWSD